MIKVAIVGSEEYKWLENQKDVARAFIRDLLAFFHAVFGEFIVLSGACPKGGIDIWAREIAKEYGVPFAEFIPKCMKWRCYKQRNLAIARTCDVIFSIEPIGKKSGGLWTLERAKRFGADGYAIFIL